MLIRRFTVLGVVTLVAVSTVAVLGGPGQAATPTAPGCGTVLFTDPIRASHAAKETPRRFEAAAAHNHKTVREFHAMATDRALWLDECGQAFYMEPISTTTPGDVEPAVTAGAPGSTVSVTALHPLADTFQLQSKPGSPRTLYLDFLGDTLTGTLWNNTYGTPLVVDPYSMYDPVDTNFTDAELMEIQKVWQAVAEDYAPFDVNVTTKDLGVDALDRSSDSDLSYGTRVMVTGSGPVFNACACGGMAALDVFNNAGGTHLYYQPAFVFTAGVGAGGKTIAEAASHEAGHVFGLTHDGSMEGAYYYGSQPWAPIMGAAYYQPVSQWSSGEYPGATNHQDDVAVIATGAPQVIDDHGDLAGSGSVLVFDTPSVGVIGTRTDVDAFTFTGSGSTQITLSPAAWSPNLHASIRIEDNTGAVVGTADAGSPDLVATWVATLPDTPSVYTVFVDGTGTGDPNIPGNYSDYGSLGNYQILQSRPVTQTPQKTVTFSDSTGDVTWFSTGTNLVSDPSRDIGDVTRTVLANRDKNVTAKITFAELKKVARSSLRMSLKIRTNESLSRVIMVTAKDGVWAGKTKITTSAGTPVTCDVSTTIRYDTKKITVRVPRSCLSNPKWVQIKASVQTVAPDETRYLDDALCGAPVLDSGTRLAWSEKAYM